MKLHELEPGARAIISSVASVGSIGARLQSLGFVPGTEVIAVRKAPMGDPVEYAVRGIRVALRRAESAEIGIVEVAP
jgi:ferrous iron transport protein A